MIKFKKWTEVTYLLNGRRYQKLRYCINENNEITVMHFSFVENKWKDFNKNYQDKFVKFCKKHHKENQC